MISVRRLNRRTTGWLVTAALVAFACAGACSRAGERPQDLAGLPTSASGITSDPSATVSATATMAPTPSPTVNAAESIGYYAAAYNLLGIGNYADAERRFDQVIALEPDFARGWDGRGQAHMAQGEYEEALFDFDRAIALKPNLAQAYAHRAMVRMAVDDVAGARRDALQALEMDSSSVEAYLVMGRIYSGEGRYEDSFDSFNTAVELAPDDAGTWLWRGRFWRDVVGEFSEALADFTRAIELQPAHASLYLDRAILFTRWSLIGDAKADLEEALSLSTDPALAAIHDQARDMLEELNRAYPQETATSTAPVT